MTDTCSHAGYSLWTDPDHPDTVLDAAYRSSIVPPEQRSGTTTDSQPVMPAKSGCSDLVYALAYAEHGWKIFPTGLIKQPNGSITKQPLIKDWPNRATTDPGIIHGWFRRWPDAVVSLVTGALNGFVVLDIDIKGDQNGLDTLEALGIAILPETPMVHTRSGGLHLYFRRTAPLRNSTGRYGLGPNLDVRGDNGQVVLPSANSGYSWDPHYNFKTVEPLPAPAWFNHRQKPQRRSDSGPHPRLDPNEILSESCRLIRTAAVGTRHDTYRHETFRIARLVGLGLLNERSARHELETEILALGIHADGYTGRVEKYFGDAWKDGLAAARRAA